MARVKAEVREQRQARHAVKTEVLSPRAPLATAPPVVLAPEPTPVATGCIDLTGDDETEDEEEADEPFAAAARSEQLREPVEEPPKSAEELPTARSEREKGVEEQPAGGFLLSPAEDESEVDEEMPQAPASLEAATGATLARLGPEAGEYSSAEDETQPCSGDGDDEMEEVDELWPALPPPIESNAERARDVGNGSTASDGEGSVEEPESAAPPVKTGESLEDGEIFEEGAVIKSPRTVKRVISQELQAVRAAIKKKQKKRGRKKNKRKVELMTAPEDVVDEFGRNVRHQPSAPLVLQASVMNEYLPSLAAHSGPPSLPPPTVLAPASMMSTPPLPPPLPETEFGGSIGGPRPFVDEEIVRVNRHGGFEPFQFHGQGHPAHALPLPTNGGFRYVSTAHFSAGNKETSPPLRGIKRPLLPPPEQTNEPAADNNDVFDLDSLRAAALKTKKKTPIKAKETADSEVEIPERTTTAETTPIPSPPPQDDEDSLDALRMQLLSSIRRKRRDPSNASASSTTESESTLNGTAGPNDQVSTSPPDLSEPKATSPVHSTSEGTLRPPVAKVLTSSTGTALVRSLQFQPLTAMTQSIVIRLTLDDLENQSKVRADSFDEATKRLETLARGGGVQPKPSNSQSQTAEKLPSSPANPTQEADVTVISTASTAETSNDGTISEKKSCVVEVSAHTRADSKEGEAAEKSVSTVEENLQTGSSKKGDQVGRVDKEQVVVSATVSASVVEEEVLSDTERLEAEHKACQAKIRDADSRIARIDADIAALRRVIAAREAEGSSVTACGA